MAAGKGQNDIMNRTAAGTDGLQFVLSDEPDIADWATIHEQIRAFNGAVCEYHRTVRGFGPQPLDIYLRDGKDRLVGGLAARTYWRWLEVEDLWLQEALRGRGFGRKLLTLAEAEVVARGCSWALVRTFSFQARGFYEALGYRIAGRLDNYPPGQIFFWMRKDLAPVEGQGTE
jgi:GNAT superfamily N-acetyltransferase